MQILILHLGSCCCMNVIAAHNGVGARLCVYTCVWFCSWGVLPQCMLGYRPPGSRHPPVADTPHPPGPGTPQEQTPPRADTPTSHHPPTPHPGSRHPPGPGTAPQGPGTPPWEQTPPPRAQHAGRYGQRAGGRHPTGMQSCLFFLSGDDYLSGNV